MPTDSSPGAMPDFGAFRSSLRDAIHEDYGQRPGARVRSAEDFAALREHLLDLYGTVEVRHSFVDQAGQVFDCIPVESQPALRRSGQALATPPVLPNAAGAPATPSGMHLQAGRLDRFGQAMCCPAGTVPVRRVTLEELARFETMEHFLRKSPRASRGPRPILLSHPDAAAAGSQHRYAHAYQPIANVGGHSILNVWLPGVSEDNSFSLSQQWYVATGDRGVQTAEAGWQVFPQKYGHPYPVLFTYWTADGYRQTGSYNCDAHDFVQYSPTCPVGMAVQQTSASGGAQAELALSFYLSEGNWWLFVGGTDPAHAVGYYPTQLYGGGPMATGAAEIDFGGETVAAGVYPPMGSGEFATAGYGHAAYQRNILVYPPAGVSQQPQLQASQNWPASYTIALGEAAEWGRYFYFGGPGGAA